MDYPIHVLRAILTHWEEIESIKYRITPSLVPDSTVAPPPVPMTEGETLNNYGPRTTRIPSNNNAKIERLCDMTCDIERGRKLALTQAEDIALIAIFNLDKEHITPELSEKGNNALLKLCAFLNNE
jgi:hypothetical protein